MQPATMTLEELENFILERLPRVLEQDPRFVTFIEGIVSERFPRRDEFALLLQEVRTHRQETTERFDGVDKHFETVDGHLVGLDDHLVTVDGHLVGLDNHLVAVDGHLVGLDNHLVAIDGHLVALDEHLVTVDGHLVALDEHLVTVDARLDKIDDHLVTVDHRLDKMDDHLVTVDHRLDKIEVRLDKIDQRFEQVDQRFEQVDQRFEQVDQRFEQVDQRFAEMKKSMDDGFHAVHVAIDRLGQRWGIRNEAIFRQTMREILEKSFGARVEERRLRGEQYDVVIIGDAHILVEISASVGKDILKKLQRKRQVYVDATGVTPARFLLAVGDIHSSRANALRAAGFEVVEPVLDEDGNETLE